MNAILFIFMLFCPFFAHLQDKGQQKYIEQQSQRTNYSGDRPVLRHQWYCPWPNDLNSSPFGSVDDDYDEEEESSDVNAPHYSVNSFTISDVSEKDLERSRVQTNQQASEQKIDVRQPDPVNIPKISFPKRKKKNIEENLDDTTTSANSNFLNNIAKYMQNTFILLVLVILSFLIYKMLSKLRGKNATIEQEIEHAWNPNRITKSELEKKLDQAQFDDNYRECIRIHYLLILKKLIDQNKIVWQVDKTNHDYIRELRNMDQHRDFAECVHVFELVWYGQYQINQQQYRNLKTKFERYFNTLSLESVSV